jgi:hypothetical protein
MQGAIAAVIINNVDGYAFAMEDRSWCFNLFEESFGFSELCAGCVKSLYNL